MRYALLFTAIILAIKLPLTGNPALAHTVNSPAADTAAWLTSFKAFRTAVYNKDKQQVKTFLSFPVMNEANEIWYVAYGNDEKKMRSIPGKIKPFTEKDFDKYYDRLFSKSFIGALMKIKSEELYKKGTAETPELRESNNTTYRMYASVDKAAKTLSLNLAFNTVIKDENGEVQDGGESNIIYEFKISNHKIVFRQLRIAG
ncbi:MAG: hypothetical protein U0V75_09450 [Ferruginibacter sp.]